MEAHGGAARLLVLVDSSGDLRPSRPVAVDFIHHCNADVIGSLHNPWRQTACVQEDSNLTCVAAVRVAPSQLGVTWSHSVGWDLILKNKTAHEVRDSGND